MSARPSGLRASALQLVRFAGVGLAMNGVLYVVYLVLVAQGLDPKLAFTTTFLLATPLSFWSHYRVSFLGEGQWGARPFARFLVLHFGGYALNLAALYVLVDRHHVPHAPVQAVMILLVAGVNFLGQKLWVFRV